MKELARWAMLSRRNAILAVSLCTAIPMLFWLGAALLSLTIMRQGLEASRSIVAWALLPAVAWLGIGDPMPFMAVAGSAILAAVLRTTVRLDITLIAASVVGCVLYLLLPLLMPEILALILESAIQVAEQLLAEQAEVLLEYNLHIQAMVQGFLSAIYLLIIILSVLLGRYLQSGLYNPKGFGLEFKQLKLPVAYSAAVIVLILTATTLPPVLAGMVPAFAIPVLLAGLALLHGLASKKAGSGWMIPVYLALFLFGPYMFTLLIFLALLDSMLNFRKLKKDTA